MRFLKTKVFKSEKGIREIPEPIQTRFSARKTLDSTSDVQPPKIEKNIQKSSERPSHNPKSGRATNMHDVKSTKNIVKNYGRAICNFILTPLFLPYFNDIVERDKENVTLEEFQQYISERKEAVDCIERFKEMLIVSKSDSEKEGAFKRIFKKSGIIFIKYFSVNWIFHGRVTYKESHLYFRHKMLRRLNNPHLFTYLKSFAKK